MFDHLVFFKAYRGLLLEDFSQRESPSKCCRLMNCPRLENLGALNLLSLCNLEDLVFDLSGCGHISAEDRMELHQSMKSLKRFRGKHLETWVNIEGLPNRSWFPFGLLNYLMKSLCSHCCRSVRQLRQRLGAPHVNSRYLVPVRLGRSIASSDESEFDDTETDEVTEYIDESKPFPCSHPGCKIFHAAESGYCEKHRWYGWSRTICHQLNTCRHHVELAMLIITQAVAEVESRFLLFAILLSLLPIGTYSLSHSTGVPATVIAFFFMSLALISVTYTTARLNRMHQLSKEIQVQSESIYAKSLNSDMSVLFEEQGPSEIIQSDIKTLKHHFLEARKHVERFNRELCMPLRRFLEGQAGLASSNQLVRPVLKSLLSAQSAMKMTDDPSCILDLLYCDVIFDDLNKMALAWQFIRKRAESFELRDIHIVRMRDSFASLQAGRRCAEMVYQVDSYLVAMRFYEASLMELEAQVDEVHSLAEELGLLVNDSRTEMQVVSSRHVHHPRYLAVALFALRGLSLLAAMYLAAQYFIRYSPSTFRAGLEKPLKDAFALKEKNETATVSEFETDETWRPSIVLSLPYLVLVMVLLHDLDPGCQPTVRGKLKPTQVLYQEYFGLQGQYYTFKVAILQLLTVLLQAFGKLRILGGIVSFAVFESSTWTTVFQRCFWIFVGFLCLNSLYPTILFLFPFEKWARLGAAIMDAILDVAYTMTYLVITLLAIYKLRLDETIQGNFGEQEAANFDAELEPGFALPSDVLGYLAVYYSMAHVCAVCRALEHIDWKEDSTPLQASTSPSIRRPTHAEGFWTGRTICKAMCFGYNMGLLCMFFTFVCS